MDDGDGVDCSGPVYTAEEAQLSLRGGGRREVGIHSEVSGVVVWANCSSLVWGLSGGRAIGEIKMEC